MQELIDHKPIINQEEKLNPLLLYKFSLNDIQIWLYVLMYL